MRPNLTLMNRRRRRARAMFLVRGDLPDWWNNACLNVMHGGDEIGYTEGYLRGAQRLVGYVTEKQTDQDFLVYPIIFLYRHHIELALKTILRRAPYLIDRELTQSEEAHLGALVQSS